MYQVSDGAARTCLALEDNGAGMSFEQLRKAMQLAPWTGEESMLGRHGEGMKMSLFHLRGGENSRVYLFAQQGNERTVAVFGADEQNFASVTLLPVPAAFMENPGKGTDSDLISMVNAADKSATRNAVAKVAKLPAAGGAAGDSFSPYDSPKELAQVAQFIVIHYAHMPSCIHGLC